MNHPEQATPLREYENTPEWHLDQAKGLLRPGEFALPIPVAATVLNLSAIGIWFSLSRNDASTSCREAADRRVRLGHKGIPLFDELKTLSGKDKGGRGVMIHTRADRKVDFSKLIKVVDVDEEEFFYDTYEEYGKVNPFADSGVVPVGKRTFLTSDVYHVVDQDVLSPKAFPGTMMTNAGESTWAVEFKPADLFERIREKTIADITNSQDTSRPFDLGLDRPISIITGNSPMSGVTLTRLFLERYNSLLPSNYGGDLAQPSFDLISRPWMGESMELDLREGEIRRELKTLVRGRVRTQKPPFIVLADNTTDYFAPELREIAESRSVPFISTSEATASIVRALGLETVGLLGVRWVAESDKYSSFRKALAGAGVSIEILSPDRIAAIDRLAHQVKQKGTNESERGKLINEFRDTLRQEIDSTVVITALTEMTELFEMQGGSRIGKRTGKFYIDTMEVLADAMAHACLGIPFPSEATIESYRKRLWSVAGEQG